MYTKQLRLATALIIALSINFNSGIQAQDKAKEKEIFKVVEQMPRFPGCENIEAVNNEREHCAKEKMLEYIYTNIRYPEAAKNDSIEGMCVVQFVVEADGSIGDTKLVRDIGGGCGEEAVRVVNTMNAMEEKWIPGKQRGKPVSVIFTLPVKYKL
jgi:protein TonB